MVVAMWDEIKSFGVIVLYI